MQFAVNREVYLRISPRPLFSKRPPTHSQDVNRQADRWAGCDARIPASVPCFCAQMRVLVLVYSENSFFWQNYAWACKEVSAGVWLGTEEDAENWKWGLLVKCLPEPPPKPPTVPEMLRLILSYDHCVSTRTLRMRQQHTADQTNPLAPSQPAEVVA